MWKVLCQLKEVGEARFAAANVYLPRESDQHKEKGES
jgi:hypothetical protein